MGAVLLERGGRGLGAPPSHGALLPPPRPGLGVPGGLGAGLAFPVRLLVRRGSGASDPLEARGGCFSCPGSRPGQSM